MSKFKGTPGPWIVDRTVIRGDADHLGRTVAVASTLNVAWPFGRRAIKEEPYNAHLIAAAPELLDALMELADWYREHTGLPPTAANAAIAKALGEGQP